MPVFLLDEHLRDPLWRAIERHNLRGGFQFEDVGLIPTSTNLEIWQRCQSEELIFITNNRNRDSPDSLESTIRLYNTAISLPVFTIGNLDDFRKNRAYATACWKVCTNTC